MEIEFLRRLFDHHFFLLVLISPKKSSLCNRVLVLTEFIINRTQSRPTLTQCDPDINKITTSYLFRREVLSMVNSNQCLEVISKNKGLVAYPTIAAVAISINCPTTIHTRTFSVRNFFCKKQRAKIILSNQLTISTDLHMCAAVIKTVFSRGSSD